MKKIILVTSALMLCLNIYGTEKSDIPAANSQGDGNTTPVMTPIQMRDALQRQQEEITRLNSIIQKSSAIQGVELGDAFMSTFFRFALDLCTICFVMLPHFEGNIRVPEGILKNEVMEHSWFYGSLVGLIFLTEVLRKAYPLHFHSKRN